MTYLRVLCLIIGLVAGFSATAESTWEWAPERKIGDALPVFSADDHHGRHVAINDLAGRKGLLLFFNRSTDW